MSDGVGTSAEFPAAAKPGESPALAFDRSSVRESQDLFPEKREELFNKTAYRWMRVGGFVVLGGVAVTYFACLLFALNSVISFRSLAMIFTTSPDWHYLLFIAGIFGVFSAVPLSISVALVKMVSESKPSDGESVSMTTAQAEAFKVLASFVSLLNKK